MEAQQLAEHGRDKRFALLIDADNVSAKYIKPILNELSKYGTITYKRIYGDWTLTLHAKWKDALLENSITPIQQFSYTYGKNSTDSAMIIDAMDILYGGSVEGFCIVSSDSDFTRLASRLRESGHTVIGMGEKKTPTPFRKACDIFTVLELLVKDERREKANGPTMSKAEVEQAVVDIIIDNQNNGKATGLGEIGSRLQKRYPDFDVRNYGTNLLSKLLGEFTRVKITKDHSSVAVELTDAADAGTTVPVEQKAASAPAPAPSEPENDEAPAIEAVEAKKAEPDAEEAPEERKPSRRSRRSRRIKANRDETPTAEPTPEPEPEPEPDPDPVVVEEAEKPEAEAKPARKPRRRKKEAPAAEADAALAPEPEPAVVEEAEKPEAEKPARKPRRRKKEAPAAEPEPEPTPEPAATSAQPEAQSADDPAGFIRTAVEAAGVEGVALTQLGEDIRAAFKDFKVRDLGFPQLRLYLASIEEFELIKDGKAFRVKLRS